MEFEKLIFRILFKSIYGYYNDDLVKSEEAISKLQSILNPPTQLEINSVNF